MYATRYVGPASACSSSRQQIISREQSYSTAHEVLHESFFYIIWFFTKTHLYEIMPDQRPSHGEDAPPPYSETDVYSNSASAGASAHGNLDDASSRMSSNGEIIYTPPETPLIPHSSGIPPQPPSSGAELFFETRPPPPAHMIPESTIVHTLQLETESLPDDFPFPSDWEKRDINPQDWATFCNFLLPDHTTRRNDIILERKLRSEAGSEAGGSITSGRSQAEFQQQEMNSTGPQGAADNAQRRAAALATVNEWNTGFFVPRGITISLAPAPESEDPAIQTPLDRGNAAGNAQNSWWSNASFKINGDSITYGKNFIIDNNGIRVGSLILDNDGVRMANHEVDAPRGPSGSNTRDPFSPTAGGPSDEHRGRSDNHTRNVNGEPDRHQRRRSASSSSSASSCSSSSTVSLESLPGYDEVCDEQMPTYTHILQDWISKPSQLRTNADVLWLKTELQLTKARPASTAAGGAVDKRAAKAQLKALCREWKQIKREQRRSHRELRSLRKKQRRKEKREHRQQRRDMKRSQRDMRRSQKHAHRHDGPMGMPFPPGFPGSQMPPGPPMPPGPSMPPGPPMPPTMGNMHNHGCHNSRPRHGHHHQGHQHYPHHPPGPQNAGWPPGPGGRGGWPFQAGMPPNMPRGPPGSWPADAGVGRSAAGPSSAVAAKYYAAQQMEDAILKQQQKASSMQDGPGKDALNNAIESLHGSLQSLRMDADEEYARDLGGSEVPGGTAVAVGTCWTNVKGSTLNQHSNLKRRMYR